MQEKKKRAEELAWEMFEQTGKMSYYMLYQQLKEKP